MELFVQLALNGIIAGALYTLIAVGFNLIYGTVKFFDLGYGAMVAVGGYSAWFFSRQLGLNIFLSSVIAVLITGVIGILIYWLIYSSLRKRKASNMVLLVASLGVITAIQAIIAILFTSQFKTLSVGTQKLYHLGPAVITQIQLVTLIVGIAAVSLLALLLKKTYLGRAIRAISDDEDVSKIIGINTGKIIGLVFFIGAALGALGGILFGLDTGIEPLFGFKLLLKGVIAAIIGGVGNIWGGIAGAFLLGLVENFGIWKISAEWKDAIAFGLLIVFLIFRPKGIFPK
jgi:branched-chain amino acid transport system permease protein